MKTKLRNKEKGPLDKPVLSEEVFELTAFWEVPVQIIQPSNWTCVEPFSFSLPLKDFAETQVKSQNFLAAE